MKKNISISIAVGSVVAATLMVAATALPAFALGLGLGASANISANASMTASGTGAGVGASLSARLSARIQNILGRASQEITRRLDALNALSARINEMVRLSSAEKANLAAAIQSQIGAMNTLQSQIGADAQANNTTTLKADVDSITKSYRIFALILPQGSIEAASDRVLDIANVMTDLGTKLSARISAAQAAGNNVAAAQSAMADFNAKVSDANTQATAATAEIASLTPDNGSSTIMASNTAALKDARAKIMAAQQDFVAARADAMTIIRALVTFKGSASASTTVSASTSAQ